MLPVLEKVLVPLAGIAAAGVVLLAARLWSRWRAARYARQCAEALREGMKPKPGRLSECEVEARWH